jgi:ankyrin repeat protein
VIELLKLGADINSKEEGNKETPFILSCSLGHQKIIQLLYEKGAKTEEHDDEGNTGFMLACENGHYDSVKYLLSVGFSPNVYSKIKKKTPLHFSISNGNVDISKLLIEYKANLNAVDEKQRTPLHYASLKGYPSCVKLLIEEGAEYNKKDNGLLYEDGKGKTPLELSRESIHYLKVSRVFKEEVDKKINFN